MKEITGFYFQDYQEWRNAITTRCNIKLNKVYAEKRIAALQNPKDASTREFIAKYGDDYVAQVIQWFERAAKDNG